MSIIDKATRSLDLLAVAVRSLDTIGELAKSKLLSGASDHAEALTTIVRIVETIRDGFSGKLDPARIEAEIDRVREAMASNDAAADAALDRKFPR